MLVALEEFPWSEEDPWFLSGFQWLTCMGLACLPWPWVVELLAPSSVSVAELTEPTGASKPCHSNTSSALIINSTVVLENLLDSVFRQPGGASVLVLVVVVWVGGP